MAPPCQTAVGVATWNVESSERDHPITGGLPVASQIAGYRRIAPVGLTSSAARSAGARGGAICGQSSRTLHQSSIAGIVWTKMSMTLVCAHASVERIASTERG